MHGPTRSSTSSPSSSSESSQNCESPPTKMRSLSDIYASTYALLVAEPLSYDEACGKEEWESSMKEEMSAIERNNTWELVDLPPKKKAIGVKWDYKV